MLNVLPLLHVHVTAYFCICSEQHFKIFTQRHYTGNSRT